MPTTKADQLAAHITLIVHHVVWLCEQELARAIPLPQLNHEIAFLRFLMDKLPAKVRAVLVSEMRPTIEAVLRKLQPTTIFEEARLCALKVSTAKGRTLEGWEWYAEADDRVRAECSDFIATYLTGHVRLGPGYFPDLVSRLLWEKGKSRRHPERFLRVAILREERRQARRAAKRERERQGPQPDALSDPEHVESSVMARIDWERGRTACNLSVDQQLAIEARFEGINLQGSEAPDYLGWNPLRVDSVRRSLEPDRPAGMRSRQYFQAYRKHLSEK